MRDFIMRDFRGLLNESANLMNLMIEYYIDKDKCYKILDKLFKKSKIINIDNSLL